MWLRQSTREKHRENSLCENAQLQRKFKQRPGSAGVLVRSCVCLSKAEAFCNGKQGINNPNGMREMVNATKVNRFMGLFILPR